MLITLPTIDGYVMEIITTPQISSEVISYYNYFNFYKFKRVYVASLISIFVLTK